MESIKYWYVCRNPDTQEVIVNINLPRPEKDIFFTEDPSGGWILHTVDEKYLLTWDNNYRAMHDNGCFCEGQCIFVEQAKLIDNIFLSRVETCEILSKLCGDNKRQ